MPTNSFEDDDLNPRGPLDCHSDAQNGATAATDDERSTNSRARNDGRAADASQAAAAVREAVRSTTPRFGPSIQRDLIMVAAASYLGFFIARLTR